MGAPAPQDPSAPYSSPCMRLGTATTSLQGSQTAHSFWKKKFQKSNFPQKIPFPFTRSAPAWHQGISGTAKDSSRGLRWLIYRGHCGSPAISPTLAAILPAQPVIRTSRELRELWGVWSPHPGGTWQHQGPLPSSLPFISAATPTAPALSELLPARSCCQRNEPGGTPQNSRMPGRHRQGQDILLQLKGRWMQPSPPRVPIKSLSPQTGEVAQQGKGLAPALPPTLGLLGCPSSLCCQGKGCRAKQRLQKP